MRCLVVPFRLAALFVFAAAAHAQGITVSTQPFRGASQLPIAPATPVAPSAAAQAPVAPAKPEYLLRTGQPIHQELKRWSEQGGWDLHWYHASSWKTLRDTTIERATVDEAVSEVVDILRSEGKPVQLRISEGNRVMEILSTEVRND